MSIQSLIPFIEKASGRSLVGCQFFPLGGGDINAAYQIRTPDFTWFIKVNSPALAFMLEAEAAGLQALAEINAIKVPEAILSGHNNEYSFLILEYIPLNKINNISAALLGEQLAALHHQHQPFFGWHIDNTIGSTAQSNSRHADWIEFWREQRLLKQLQLAADNGFGGKLQQRGKKLATEIDVFFSDYQPSPALLHGDLWGGNVAADQNEQPVIFDPACYYGDRETDIAMTELFGGFGTAFYQAYEQHYPLDSGYKTRKTLYNLYHIINHLNLFGSAYLHQAEAMIEQLLAEI